MLSIYLNFNPRYESFRLEYTRMLKKLNAVKGDKPLWLWTSHQKSVFIILTLMHIIHTANNPATRYPISHCRTCDSFVPKGEGEGKNVGVKICFKTYKMTWDKNGIFKFDYIDLELKKKKKRKKFYIINIFISVTKILNKKTHSVYVWTCIIIKRDGTLYFIFKCIMEKKIIILSQYTLSYIIHSLIFHS